VKVLAIDTSTPLGSVALVADGQVRAEIAASVQARHGRVLLPHVELVLSRAGVAPEEVDLFAVGIGPGSFTGVRVGVATAKGLALATGRPLRGVISLGALARGLGAAPFAVPVVDAHRGEVFAAAFCAPEGALGDPVVAPFHAPPEEAGRRLRAVLGPGLAVLCGDGLRRYEEPFCAALGGPFRLAPPLLDPPRAAVVAQLAEEDFARDGPSDLAALEPLYLRPSDAKLPAEPLVVDGPAPVPQEPDPARGAGGG